jgi:hypothetical protein
MDMIKSLVFGVVYSASGSEELQPLKGNKHPAVTNNYPKTNKGNPLFKTSQTKPLSTLTCRIRATILSTLITTGQRTLSGYSVLRRVKFTSQFWAIFL